MKKLNFDQTALEEWELKERNNVQERFVKKAGKMKDPQKGKLKEKMKKQMRNEYFYRHEEKTYRKKFTKTFRARWKVERSKGLYHIPINKEFKTYGYMTW